jgi:predicted amidohydrolase YtcJ
MKKVIYNAKVYTGSSNFAEAVLIQDGLIAALGSSGDILEAAGGAEKIDAQGKTLIPGFQDSHLHLLHSGRLSQMIDTRNCSSLEEVIRRGRELIERTRAKPGTLIMGHGLNQETFTAGEKRMPTRYDLDKISTAHPVMISRVCGHLVFCNSKMLELAGLADAAPDIDGGRIDRDETGKPLGIFGENAAGLVRRFTPVPTEEETREGLKYALDQAASFGICAAASYDTGGPDFDKIVQAYTQLYQDAPHPRIYMQCGINGDEKNLDTYINRGLTTGTPLYGEYLKMGPLKLFADGTLGAQTAWLREDYKDDPGNRGLSTIEQGVLDTLVQKAAAHGLQVVIHAIGDAAMEGVISSYEKVTDLHHNPLRHSIIHCQITDRPLLERMAARDIVAVIQPIFLARDLYIVENRVGKDRAAASYAWNTMEKLGIPTAYGTDNPIELMNPFHGIACAVSRKNIETDFPNGGFNPEEKVDVYTAVNAYTSGTAWANFNEQKTGRLAPGFIADLTLLDRDIFTIPPEEIHETKVALTMVGGETVYEG